MLLTIVAFVVALGVLIAVHEYGHYRVAVACGVKVLRFSVGFGKPLLKWQPKGSPTEFVLAAFPLGGYVKMLDEREAPVAPEERHLAFNTQPLRSRAAIVAAGPIANLLLAVVLYSVVNWTGVEEGKPLLGNPVVGSIADQAGLRGGELVVGAALGDDGGDGRRALFDIGPGGVGQADRDRAVQGRAKLSEGERRGADFNGGGHKLTGPARAGSGRVRARRPWRCRIRRRRGA